jgi:hypothetical protein
MAPGTTRKRCGTQPARKSRWLIPIAGVAAVAAVVAAGLLTVALLPANEEGVQANAGMCPNFDVDPNTGKMRDRGMIPCTDPGNQNGRLDLIRKGFSQH